MYTVTIAARHKHNRLAEAGICLRVVGGLLIFQRFFLSFVALAMLFRVGYANGQIERDLAGRVISY